MGYNRIFIAIQGYRFLLKSLWVQRVAWRGYLGMFFCSSNRDLQNILMTPSPSSIFWVNICIFNNLKDTTRVWKNAAENAF